MPTALVVLASGFEEIEAVTVIDLLRRGGIDVTVCGLEKNLVTGSHGITIKPDVWYQNVCALKYDLLIFPGGQPGTQNLKENPIILEWIRSRIKVGKKIAAICAAPTLLKAAGIAGGIKLTSYPAERDVFTNSEYMETTVVKDQNIITSRGVGTTIEFALELIAELKDRSTAEEVGRKILYNF